MTFSFLEPAFLWTLLLVPLVWFVPTRVKDIRHATIRSAVLLLLALGLARPVLFSSDEAPHFVVILDRTESVTDVADESAREAAKEALAKAPKDAVKVLIEMTSAGGRSRGASKLKVSETHALSGESTSISSAISLAASSIPKGAPGAITVISDGMATDTRWGDVVSELVEREIPLHTLKVAPDQSDAKPVTLTLTAGLRVGHSAKARVRVVAGAAKVDVTLLDGDKILATQSAITVRGSRDVVLEFEPTKAGFRRYNAKVVVQSGTDTRVDNNEITTLVAVQKPLRVLYLGHRVEGSGESVAKLLGAGFEIVEGDTSEAPPAPGSFDVAMIDDKPSAELPDEWQESLVNAVHEHGAGLLASGGRAAFGPGGYSKTAIERSLPVEMIQKEEKKDPSTTLAIIIDTSGSMVGNRMTIAKQVARLAMRRLQPHDKIGIVEFYGTKQWAAPIQSAANQIDLQRALNRLGAEGGTILMPAIEEAYYALKNVQTRYKHVLILTDAGVETGPYEAVCRRMSDEGMTVSTVLVGPGRHSEFLVELADWGGGRYYNASDRFNLPELLLKRPSTSVLPAYRPERVNLEGRAGAGWWGNIDPADVPPLDAFVETELRNGAEQLITTAKSKKPILASWVHGLGRVTAFMSEPTGPGTKSWADWSGYGPLLGRVLARTARGAREPFEYELRRRGGEITVIAQRAVREELRPTITVAGRDQAEANEIEFEAVNGNAAADLESLNLREVAPGRFEATLYWPADQPFRALAQAGSFRRRLCLDSRSDESKETQVDGNRAFPMARASAVTRGRSYQATEGSFDLTISAGISPTALKPIWPWFVLASLLFFIADVYLRRRAGGVREVN
ncbi:MAG: Ca-activated chloride channel family protein [Planctomycetota bacterium]|jgi:Ca-activated chloride channel family protein